MKSKFMDVVPSRVRVSVPFVIGGAMLTGMVVGYGVSWFNHTDGARALMYAGLGLGVGLVMGAFLAAWVLCLGYVYADALRRGMRPVLWTLIAALFPHLFGFLLYFALRQPLTPKCGSCGQPLGPEQRFCSWCGSARPVVASVQGDAQGMGPAATL